MSMKDVVVGDSVVMVNKNWAFPAMNVGSVHKVVDVYKSAYGCSVRVKGRKSWIDSKYFERLLDLTEE